MNIIDNIKREGKEFLKDFIFYMERDYGIVLYDDNKINKELLWGRV